MNLEKRDRIRLEKIVDYCNDITEIIGVLQEEKPLYLNQTGMQKIIAFDIMQIGELTASLSPEFKEQSPGIPWTQIKSVRNRIVHHYGAVNQDVLWDIATGDIPELRTFCFKTIHKNN